MLEYPWSKINITFTWLSSLYNPFKSSFRSWDFYIFVLNFWLCWKWLDKKVTVNFKIYDVADWTTNNYNTYFAQYLKK